MKQIAEWIDKIRKQKERNKGKWRIDENEDNGKEREKRKEMKKGGRVIKMRFLR